MKIVKPVSEVLTQGTTPKPPKPTIKPLGSILKPEINKTFQTNPNLSTNQFEASPSWGGRLAQAGVAAIDRAKLTQAYMRPGGFSLAARHILSGGGPNSFMGPQVREVLTSEALNSGGLHPGQLSIPQDSD